MWRRHWPVLMALVFFVLTVGFAATAIMAIRRDAGVALAWPVAVLWQGLIYGSWWPFLWLSADIVRRVGLRARLIFVLYPAAIGYTAAHAGVAAWIDLSFGAGHALWQGWLHRLPVDVLISTVIAALVVAVTAWRAAEAEAHRAADLQKALEMARAAATAETPALRLLVAVGSRRVPVDAAEVEWFAAAGNYVVVNWGGREGLVRDTLTSLQARLDAAVFARAHRSAVVNLARVQSAAALDDGGWVLTMAGGAEIVVSRTYRDDVLRRLGRV